MLPIITGEFGVVKEPEIKFSGEGKAWAKIRCSAKDRKRDVSGQWTDGEPLYINVIVGNGAENLVESVRVGDTITVQGRLNVRRYVVNDEKREEFQITADVVGVSVRWNPAKTPRASDDGNSVSVSDIADALGATEIPF